jgi:hypothetical protein
VNRRHNRKMMRGRVENRLAHAPEPMAEVYPGDGERDDGAREARILEHMRRIRSDPRWEPVDTRHYNNGGAKLTEDDVREIRRATARWRFRSHAERGRLRRELSERYGVSKASISCIARRKTWGWVD